MCDDSASVHGIKKTSRAETAPEAKTKAYEKKLFFS
jgi:hypothetical protein